MNGDSEILNDNETYLQKYPDFWKLLLPNIPSNIGAVIAEEFLVSRKVLHDKLECNNKYFSWGAENYLCAWLHEAYSYFTNPNLNPANASLVFKIRLVEYRDLQLAVIRRKWPQRDFLIMRGDMK